MLPKEYDRILFIKLALSVSKETLLKGLLDDMPLTGENKV
jgi:hypothetical protein